MTYRVPPRTTVAGLLGAVTGKPRDSYYESYSAENLSVGIVPRVGLRTTTLPQNILGTAGENMQTINSRGGGPKMSMPDPSDQRKQRVYEYVVDPEYRVYLSFRDEEAYEDAREALAGGRSTYTPSLGTANCLARIDEAKTEAELTPTEVDARTVDSIVPSIESVTLYDEQGSPIENIVNERAPLDMQRAKGTAGHNRRQTTTFVDYVVNTGGDPLYLSEDASVSVYEVGDHRVCFI